LLSMDRATASDDTILETRLGPEVIPLKSP